MKSIRFISCISFVLITLSVILFSCNKFGKKVIQSAYLPEEIPDYTMGDEQSNATIHLGRVLFYDPALSKNNTISCASCHKQAYAFADNTAVSTGFENHKTKRNSIAIQNLGFSGFGPFFVETALFWDGRESNLESLISKPISNHVEMGMDDENALLQKLNALPYISKLSLKAYNQNKLTMANLSNAMSRFIMMMNTQMSKFDQIMGMNVPQLSFNAQELRGQHLFTTTYQCNNCHHPTPGLYSNFGDFVNIGLDASTVDAGRMNVTKSSGDEGRFKIPDLHNVGITAPYMHDGRFKTLNEVLNHYSHGIQPNNNLDTRLLKDGSPLRMNISEADKEDIIAFLNTMTDYTLMTSPLLATPFKLK